MTYVRQGGGSTALADELRFRLVRAGRSRATRKRVQRMVAATLSRDTVVVALSVSGRVPELLESCRLAKRYGAKLIAITAPASPLAKLADHLIPVVAFETDFIYKPSTSRYAMMMAIDVLVTGVALRLGDAGRESLRRIKHALDAHRGGGDRQPVGTDHAFASRSRRYADRRRAALRRYRRAARRARRRDPQRPDRGDRATCRTGWPRMSSMRTAARSPGFVDVHTHDDTHVIRAPEMIPKISQGVTTVIVGNCGISASPVTLAGDPPDPMNLLGERGAFQYPTADYVAAVNARVRLNVAALVGHTALRNNQMDRLDRAATDAQIAGMRAQLEEALANGALGLSSGSRVRPRVRGAGRRGDGARRAALANAGALYTTHMRTEFDAILDAMEEAVLRRARACRS